MKIGIMSDSHNRSMNVLKAVALAGDIDMWLHCGDVLPDVELLKDIVDVPVTYVAGNCDWISDGVNEEEIFLCQGFKILLCHGHNFGVKYDTYELRDYAREMDCQIAIYGHTHISDVHKDGGVFIINPGSVSFPRDGKKPSFAILELNEGQEPEIYLHSIND